MQVSDSHDLSKLLRRYRHAAGLSQEELAEKSGVSVRNISDLERGRRSAPRPETLRLLADGLGLSPEERRLLMESARPELFAEPASDSKFAIRPLGHPWQRSIPVQLTSMIGRESVISELSELLERPEVRLITLTGPAGVGKTRLALELAARAQSAFADGGAFVNLATVTDPGLVASSIASALDLAVGSTPINERLCAFLERKQLLLVLDNFEHVLAAAPLIAAFLEAGPQLKVLATSRVRLRLSFETAFSVPSLTLPAPGDSFDALLGNEAICLFLERAQRVEPRFTLTSGNAGTVSEICHKLDGLPLAIELAASRLSVLPVAALLERLDHQLQLLTGGSRDLPERQQSMRNTIAWSYLLLRPNEQRCLRWMSVFKGGLSLAAAEATAIATRPHASGSLEIVSTLVDSSLIQRVHDLTSPARFQIPETIREYGLGQLESLDELADARMFHALHFLAYAKQGAPAPSDPVEEAWIRRLLIERDNLISAFDCLCATETADLCLEFGAAIGPFWIQVGPIREGWDRLRHATDLAPARNSRLKLQLFYNAAELAMYAGEFGAGTALAKTALEEARALGDRVAIADSVHVLAWIEELQENWEPAKELLEQELALWTELDHAFRQGSALMLLGGVEFALGDLNLARTAELRAEALFQDISARSWLAATHWYLGLLATAEGNLQEAALRYEQSLLEWTDTSSGHSAYQPLVGLADTAAACGIPERAARLLGAVDTLLEESDTALFPFDVPGYERAKASSFASLGDARFAMLHEEGRKSCAVDWQIEARAIVAAAQDRI